MIAFDMPMKNTCPRYVWIMLSTRRHLEKRLQKESMEDVL
jgi:hypothetical protein